MKFPKPIMSTPELRRFGVPNAILMTVRSQRGQTIAFQTVKNGVVYWDTDKLAKYMEKHAVRY